MTETNGRSSRVVTARRSLALGTIAAALAGSAAPAAVLMPSSVIGQDAGGIAAAAAAQVPGMQVPGVVLASSGEGESGEGEGSEGKMLDPGVALMRDLGFIEGHLRAGQALYHAGDIAAARTHMGHPIKEKYAAVAEAVAASGHGRLKDEIVALADAAEGDADPVEIDRLFSAVRGTIEEIRGAQTARTQVLGLIALTRIAGDEYSAAFEGGQIANLHEYQDSWGFLEVVAQELDEMAQGADADTAAVARKMQDSLAKTAGIYGDLQGVGDFEKSASVIFGAAARMELAAARLK